MKTEISNVHCTNFITCKMSGFSNLLTLCHREMSTHTIKVDNLFFCKVCRNISLKILVTTKITTCIFPDLTITILLGEEFQQCHRN